MLGGLDRADGLALLERSVGRVLTEEEANWAGDLWFESEGLPLRFVQAGALLRRRDEVRAGTSAVDEFGVFADAPVADAPVEAEDGDSVPLPSLGEAAAPAPLLASRLSASARGTLRFAVALGGEVPHQAHLPALVGDTHADAALGELVACGLVSPVGARYRLAAGVQTQLEAAGYGDEADALALAAAQHYTWWAGHPSVGPERVCAESDALLAALGVLAPATTAPGEGQESATVQLARTAAPAFAAGLDWSAWEQTLQLGDESARLAEDVAERAYFHHELGVLALCGGELDRARSELETSVGLRGALADKRGTVASRRALALVADRSGTPSGLALPAGLGSAAGEEVSDARHDESASPARGIPTPFPPLRPPARDTTSVAVQQTGAPRAPKREERGIRAYARRNLVAAGAGALLVAVLGTVVTLGATSNNDANDPSDRVGVNPTAGQGAGDDSLGADKAAKDGTGSGDTGPATSRPTDPGPDGTLGTSDDPTPKRTAGPSDDPSGTRGSQSSPSSSPSTPSTRPSTSRPASPTGKPTGSSGSPSPSTSGSPSPTGSGSPSGSPTSTAPSTGNSASGPASSSAPAATSRSASAPVSGGQDTPPTGSDPLI